MDVKERKKNNPRFIAVKDINKYLGGSANPNHYTAYGQGKRDCWTVMVKYLDTKEQRNLNRALGLWGANKGCHNMGRFKKKKQ